MKVYRIFNILMVLFFIVAIFLPLIDVNKTKGTVSLAENRALANFPDFKTNENKLNTHFIKDFENWFNDNIGYREKLVKANTFLQYKLFGTLTKPDTMIGKNNWLYYVNSEIIKDYQHLNLPSEQQLHQWGNSLEKINAYLKNKNIPFITMLNLDKKTIYSENYPDTILTVGNLSRTQKLENYINEYTNLDFFTPKDALMQAKSKATVYSPRYDNAHWNKYGAFIGYLELMSRVKRYFPDVKILSWNDFDITTYEREIKVYNSVSFSETDYGLNKKSKNSAVQIRGVLEGLNLTYGNQSYKYENNNKGLPKALVIGDSYFYEFVIPELAESFSEFTFIHTDNIDRIENIVNVVNPDIVVYENVERKFDHTMQILNNSTESYSEYSSYNNLPNVTEPLMSVDYVNNEPVQKQGKVYLDKSKEVVNIIGWAVDSKKSDTANSVFLKVGDKYYPSIYGIVRTGVADNYKNLNYTNSGFTFYVKASDLINEGKISFIIISKDKNYQYQSEEYQVEIK